MGYAFEKAFGEVTRSVEKGERDGHEVRIVRLARAYRTTPADMWDAVTNPERLPRWFLPVSGDLQLGGRYHLKGNADGEILVCDAPKHLGLTWEFGENMSWVDVHLAAKGDDQTQFTLEHAAPLSDHWRQYGPGATGVGWELGLLSLGVHFGMDDPRYGEEAWMATDECKVMMRRSSLAWADAHIAMGADPAMARQQAKATGDFYTGETEDDA